MLSCAAWGKTSIKCTDLAKTVINEFQNVFAKLEERDWVLINESRRPHLIQAPTGQDSAEDRASGSGRPGATENEFQIVLMAKGGIGLSLVSKNPSEELLFAFMSFVVVEYQSSATHRFDSLATSN